MFDKKEYMVRYRSEHKEQNKLRVKLYNQRDDVKLRKREWYEQHKSNRNYKSNCLVSAKKYSSKPEIKAKQQAYMVKYNKEYKQKNKEMLRTKNKEYNSTPSTKERIKIYKKENSEKVRKWNLCYAQKNREKINSYQRIYSKIPEVKQRYRLYNNEYEKKRKRVDINFRLRKYLSSRLRAVLKGRVKESGILSLIGCSLDHLRLHIQSQFNEGMNWQNHGKWHIDHIRPCASFDLQSVEEQKKCFNYKNLQPLWAYENKSKGDKYGYA